MDKENKHQCLLCNAIFSGKGSLKNHEDSIHKHIKFDCQDCGKQFTQKGKLTMHINSVHKGIQYKCDQCDKEFTEAGTNISNQFMKKRNIPAQFVIIKQQHRVV